MHDFKLSCPALYIELAGKKEVFVSQGNQSCTSCGGQEHALVIRQLLIKCCVVHRERDKAIERRGRETSAERRARIAAWNKEEKGA
jgi:hypothetical protein